ncbi:hypothetical protein PPO43_08375 [Saprospira sp. CCB-QB6]|uniref:hypothetical protein n=1 Tax=Saprospira sp. CCB-QB6 TaxID=3023936 RepID=UPI0023493374|nr:hypothetical protein [Saprospira sp. CCB-QB6]WCL79993.1 hypothetical protein PPO43_08375 [Saprospira sp. CCB-QB6]
MRSPLAIILAVLGLGGLAAAAYFMDLPAYFVQNKEITVAVDSSGPDSLPTPLFPDPNRIDFVDEEGDSFSIELINPTYLSNERRNYYGDSLPDKLDVIWQLTLGSGKTQVGRTIKNWSGAGWTGQPLMVIENGKKYIIQGAFDHRLKKIDYETGEVLWQYRFDDVVKGTGSLWINHKADSLKDRVLVLQGTRAGGKLNAPIVDCYRAISYFTGEERWRVNSPRTRCYSRDVDGSALIINDTAYLPLETSIFTVFNPDPKAAKMKDGLLQPEFYRFQDTLYRDADASVHGGNVVSEASPVRLRDHVYIASGSGRVWGYNMKNPGMDWEYFIGSDIDGSPVVTDDSCILVSVEKQYIKGQGGILKLDPSKKPEDATVWYMPVKNRKFVGWLGGVIGTAATNEASRKAGQPHIGATIGIDGYTYFFDLNKVDTQKVTLFDGERKVPTPKVYYKHRTGPAIASPIIIGNRAAVPTYQGFYLFEFDDQMNFKLLDKKEFSAEATPFVDQGRIFIASRDGNLYCLGRSDAPTKRVNSIYGKTEVNPKNGKLKRYWKGELQPIEGTKEVKK